MVNLMTIEIDAVYENGVLNFENPLPFPDGKKVRVIVRQAKCFEDTYGLLGWKGSTEEAERFALDPELEYMPLPEDR